MSAFSPLWHRFCPSGCCLSGSLDTGHRASLLSLLLQRGKRLPLGIHLASTREVGTISSCKQKIYSGARASEAGSFPTPLLSKGDKRYAENRMTLLGHRWYACIARGIMPATARGRERNMRSSKLLHRLLLYIAKLRDLVPFLGRWKHRSGYVRTICRHSWSSLSPAAFLYLAVSAHSSSAMVSHPACRETQGATGRRGDELYNFTDYTHTVYSAMGMHARPPPLLRHEPGALHLQFLRHCYTYVYMLFSIGEYDYGNHR
jgi:hypothetical protein